jgi:5S rRNA maturation endonuclease (ribonuclease M5)
MKKNKYNSNNVYKEWGEIDSINRHYKIGREVREVLIDLDKDGVEIQNRFMNLIPGHKLLT